jgi:GAF domain-containing protein
MDDIQVDVQAIGRMAEVPTILEVICKTTGMGFSAVARVTDIRWIACAILDNGDFGLKAGGELKVESTIRHEIRQSHDFIVVDDVDESLPYLPYRGHHTPAIYGLKSYISVPIIRGDGSFFGTRCAIDAAPRKVDNSVTIGMFRLFAKLIVSTLGNNADLVATAKSQSKSARRRPEAVWNSGSPTVASRYQTR